MEANESRFRSYLNEFKSYSKNINWFNFALISVFSVSSWVCTNAIWSELPAFISDLPEHWGITSVLTLLGQIAQLFIVFVFLFLNKMCPNIFSYKRTIYFKMCAVALTMLLLCFYWNKTTHIGGLNISIGLYIFYFFTSLLDGLSTMIYLPFISEAFNNNYIMPNYIGEAISSSIPSIFIFFQNIPTNEYFCQNQTTVPGSSTDYKLNFSVSTYFGSIFGFVILCLVSFIILDKRSSKSRKIILIELKSKNETDEFISERPIVKKNTKEKCFLLTIIFMLSFLMYGVLPGIQTFSTLPYGDLAFNLSINLGNLFLPFAVILSLISHDISTKKIFFEFVFGTILSGILIAIAIKSPCPIFVGQWYGSLLAVGVWILVECIFIRLRFLIAKKLESLDTNMLTLGIFTLLGQVLGGCLIYVCIHIFKLLQEKPSCVYDFSYCL